uniref:Uncharacterized protein n=1 Tax=Cuerna arida TaxID=1464854 RepID=A0A1B6H183_9HEMI
MMQYAILVVTLAVGVSAQFFPQQELSFAIQPPPVQQPLGVQHFAQQSYAHRAVVANAEREAQLPAQLLNPFYKNQRIAGALAKESWFTPGENLVVDREAEKIPRQRIYSVLKNAGLVNRRRR